MNFNQLLEQYNNKTLPVGRESILLRLGYEAAKFIEDNFDTIEHTYMNKGKFGVCTRDGKYLNVKITVWEQEDEEE